MVNIPDFFFFFVGVGAVWEWVWLMYRIFLGVNTNCWDTAYVADKTQSTLATLIPCLSKIFSKLGLISDSCIELSKIPEWAHKEPGNINCTILRYEDAFTTTTVH